LSWRVEFHHNDHVHPALDATEGIESGSFRIPQVGEINDNVFYRIFLTATDNGGLPRTVFRDVQPVKTQFTVLTEPAGLSINVDGKTVTAPFTVTSVEGIRRTISAPASQQVGTKLYFFDQWQNGTQEDFYTFLAGEQASVTARFTVANLSIGNGTGLNGTYYQFDKNTKPDSAFSLIPKFTRLDSVINFDWADQSPDLRLQNDYFAVRWVGKVMPPLTGTYTFRTSTDDGVRLWVDNKLLVNQWIPQQETEHTGTIALEAGKLYPIRMEFHELGGLAAAKLFWNTDKLPRQVIPSRQLFPDRLPKIPYGQNYDVRLSPNPAASILLLDIDSRVLDFVTWRIFDAQGRAMQHHKGEINANANRFEIDLTNLAAGVYFIQIDGTTIHTQKEFIKH
jgi:hypothetical protein